MQDQPQSGQQQQQQQQSQQNPLELPLFSVNKNALKGEEEMRRMFGRDVVRMRHQEDEAADLGVMFCQASHRDAISGSCRHAQPPQAACCASEHHKQQCIVGKTDSCESDVAKGQCRRGCLIRAGTGTYLQRLLASQNTSLGSIIEAVLVARADREQAGQEGGCQARHPEENAPEDGEACHP